MSGTQIAMLDPGRLDELEPLWLALHRHHRAVADLPVLRDDALSWQRRRDWYAAMLSGGHDFALVARTDGEPEPVGYAFVHIRPGDDDTWPVGSHMAELVSLAVAPDRARPRHRHGAHGRRRRRARPARRAPTSRWP